MMDENFKQSTAKLGLLLQQGPKHVSISENSTSSETKQITWSTGSVFGTDVTPDYQNKCRKNGI